MAHIKHTTSSSSQGLKALFSQADGRTQASRSLPELANRYFSGQERSLSDWLNYIYSFSRNIAFVDYLKLQKNGRWQAAMPTAEQANSLEQLLRGLPVSDDTKTLASRPDIGLLLAFFMMLKQSQGQFNDFTGKHKQFYYRQVLGFMEKPAVADKAHIVITLSDNICSKTLVKGTQFEAGEDQGGRILIYQSQDNTILNHSQVSKLITLSKMPGSDVPANDAGDRLLLTHGYTADQGLEFSPEGVLAFGEESITDEARQLLPSLGFTLASSELYLSSGHRRINISFRLKENDTWPGGNIIDYFYLSISTQEGLLALEDEVSEVHETYTDDNLLEQFSFNISVVMNSFFPAITEFTDETQPLIPKSPYLSFVLKDEHQDKMESLSRGNFKSIEMSVSVSGLTGVVASNDAGAIDTSKPFEPFTFAPRISSKFNFTHPELLVKNVKNASLDFRWVGRPDNLTEYYKSYADYRHLGQEGDAIWPPNLGEIFYSDNPNRIGGRSLFSDAVPVNNIDAIKMSFIEEDTHYQKVPLLYPQLPLNSNLASDWPKWFSLELNNNDFGHSDYSQVAQYVAYNNIESSSDTSEGGNTLVPPPYTPVLNELLIDYNSRTEINLTEQVININESHNQEQPLKHIHPLGRPNVSATNDKYIALVPNFTKQGYLYIGVANVQVPGQFRLYFQLDPVDGSNISDAPTLEWSYLDAVGWTTFSRSQGGRAAQRGRIIEDSTFNLLDTGVVAFELPKLDLSHNFMGDNLLWIRVSISDERAFADAIAKYSRIRNVFAQGIEVELMHQPPQQLPDSQQNENEPPHTVYYHPSHYAQPLAAQSITSLLNPDPEVANIVQPYSSFAGKKSEMANALEIRASERLRHKNRALTSWDFEHLVLAEFPELFMVRCYRNALEKSVDIVVVPVNYDPSILQPKVPLFLKRRIQRFLDTISPPSISVRVIDPVYEEVAFDVTLNIAQGYDLDSTVLDVNQILIDYMTPWNKHLANNTVAVSKTIYLTEVAATLERHPGVEVIYVLRAQINNRFQTGALIPSSDASILVPVPDHKINLLNKEVEVFEGIGKWKIEDDFEIS